MLEREKKRKEKKENIDKYLTIAMVIANPNGNIE